MSLNDAPSGERIHIGVFGARNAGKSSLVNAMANQQVSVVSDTAGTTTDPVRKAMELLPLGPVLLIDTPGFDDEGKLGEQRVARARETLRRADLALLVVDACKGLDLADLELQRLLDASSVPYVIAYSKADALSSGQRAGIDAGLGANEIVVSALAGEGIEELKEMLARRIEGTGSERRLIADLLEPGDFVVLVTPIDESAPKGRMILPQQMAMRDILDSHAAFACCQPQELELTLKSLSAPPRIVVTDSQAFGFVADVVPAEVQLTSFSILMARYKGNLPQLVKGAAALDGLRDGSKVLMAEGCTHHRQCADIGTVKIPNWIRSFTGVEPLFETSSGLGFPDDLSSYDLIVHCGGCTLNEREMEHRLREARRTGVPMVNYGVAVAHMNGILKRSLQPFPQVASLLGQRLSAC
ncbi:MAG: [FeFe] hydrogenase H-cluster maturation GTPase HydF [bacterium]|nr:[FeFe] hydrogenase H-cluster maturation GTPase HydF [bacterium]